MRSKIGSAEDDPSSSTTLRCWLALPNKERVGDNDDDDNDDDDDDDANVSETNGCVVDWLEVPACIICDRAGEKLLVCCVLGCPLAIHEKCVKFKLQFDGLGRFYCPYCAYKRERTRVDESRKEAALVRKCLSVFVDSGISRKGKGKEKVNDGNVVEINDDDGADNLGEDDVQDDGDKRERTRVMELREEAVLAQKDMSQFLDTGIAGNGMGEEKVNDMNVVEISDNDGVSNLGEDNILNDEGDKREKTGVMELRMEAGLAKQGASHFLDSGTSGTGKGEEKVNDGNVNDGNVMEIHDKDGMENLGENELQNEGDGGNITDHDRRGVAMEDEGILLPSDGYASDNVQCGQEEKQVADQNKDASSPKTSVQARKHSKKSAKIDTIVGFPNEKRKRLHWTSEEEEILKEGLKKFQTTTNKNIPWRKILEFGKHVFHPTRNPTDLKEKWRRNNHH